VTLTSVIGTPSAARSSRPSQTNLKTSAADRPAVAALFLTTSPDPIPTVPSEQIAGYCKQLRDGVKELLEDKERFAVNGPRHRRYRKRRSREP
jgi:hypothetical protein